MAARMFWPFLSCRFPIYRWHILEPIISSNQTVNLKTISSNLFVERLSHAMKKLGFSQRDLAAAVGVSQGTVSGWLNGAKPQGLSAKALADYLAVRVEWLVGEEEGEGGNGPATSPDKSPNETRRPSEPDFSSLILLEKLAREYRRHADEIDEYLAQKKFKR